MLQLLRGLRGLNLVGAIGGGSPPFESQSQSRDDPGVNLVFEYLSLLALNKLAK